MNSAFHSPITRGTRHLSLYRRARVVASLLSVQLMILGSIAHAASLPVKIDADPDHGFHWPYYLYVPTSAGTSTTLLVETNNTGYADDDFSVHDAEARYTAWLNMPFGADLGCPVLVPAFPRPVTSDPIVCTHALDRYTLLTTLQGLERIDLQLIAMIDDARARLAARGVTAGPKVFMTGFSASAMFANRFAVLHPDRVQAAAIGAPGGWPIAPVSSYQGQNLRFPVGVWELAGLVGTPFDPTAYVTVPHYFYLGDQDTNDLWSDPSEGSEDGRDAQLIHTLFGTTPLSRWPVAHDIYSSIGADATFVVYPGIGHTRTATILRDIGRFFRPDHPVRDRHIKADPRVQCTSIGTVRLEWATLPGLTYQVQSSPDLKQWSDEPPILGGDDLIQTFEAARGGDPRRFYRIESFFTPPSGTQGHFLVFHMDLGHPLTIRCSGLGSGGFTASDGSSGTFTYDGQLAEFQLEIISTGPSLSIPGVISGTLDSSTGTFTGQAEMSDGESHLLEFPFEMLTAP